MRYREVEDILPYYCECLIHLHILFESEIISFESGKIQFHFSEKTYQKLKELYSDTFRANRFKFRAVWR